MGIGFTIDSPIKVAHYGISSAISIIEDQLIEQMRKIYCAKWNILFLAIPDDEPDSRAKRITSYLNLIDYIVKEQLAQLVTQPFNMGNDITKYFDLLPDNSPLKLAFINLKKLSSEERIIAENDLRRKIVTGAIEVNIMTKIDKPKLDKEGNELPAEFSDALSALRGFANSNLNASVIFSAGLNPRLYSYCESFEDFFPDKNGFVKKKIILKVSDYRSALIQGKFLAKKGLWISEFRIESGLNCGGHAFATEGLLMGPILEEFKNRRDELLNTLYEICESALVQGGKYNFATKPNLKITAQGGIGTSMEHNFLLKYYQLNSTGWGSPFLLVPEVTNVDEYTLQELANAKQDDYYLSNSSPLGVPFNNFKLSSSEEQRKLRIEKKRPGSPCYKKFLEFNTEFTEKPICTASRQYQKLKIEQLELTCENEEVLKNEISKVMEKDCLCEGLGASALLKNDVKPAHKLSAVAICPGPNLAYFSGVFSLKQMVDHIYGRTNILNKIPRSNMFINELKLYVQYWKNENKNFSIQIAQKRDAYLNKFKENLLQGIEYYKNLANEMENQASELFDDMLNELLQIEKSLLLIRINSQTPVVV